MLLALVFLPAHLAWVLRIQWKHFEVNSPTKVSLSCNWYPISTKWMKINLMSKIAITWIACVNRNSMLIRLVIKLYFFVLFSGTMPLTESRRLVRSRQNRLVSSACCVKKSPASWCVCCRFSSSPFRHCHASPTTL